MIQRYADKAGLNLDNFDFLLCIRCSSRSSSRFIAAYDGKTQISALPELDRLMGDNARSPADQQENRSCNGLICSRWL
jgi:hypothetical protein